MRHVIELRHAIGYHERVVVGQTDDAGAELDVARAIRRHGDEQFGGGNDLPSRAVVLADPRFVKTQVIEPLDQLEVAVHGKGRVFPDAVEGAEKDAKLHALRQPHSAPPLSFMDTCIFHYT